MTIAEVAKKIWFYYGYTALLRAGGAARKRAAHAGGIRDYSEEDCNWVEFIKCMRGAGVSIQALAEYIRLFYEGADTIPKRKALLEGERERILERIGELTAALERLNFKLDGYEERMLAREEKLK